MILDKRYTHLILILCVSMSCYSSRVVAQQVVTGKITDHKTEIAVEYAAVTLTYGKSEKILMYTLTDQAGEFSLPCKEICDSLFLSVSLLGYKPVKIPAQTGQRLHIQLEQQTFSLKEVEIRPGRVWGRRDTINYDVASFISPNDESIKDVLRKLPGVDVSDLNGKISYNGKEISNFYVENMELMGGKYNQLAKGLKALAVDKVQILDNHQPVRMLRDKVLTENVALNIKLKPEFKDRWMGNISGGLGANKEQLLWESDANAIQISRKSQSAYFYKGNNTGDDVSLEQQDLTHSTTKTNKPSLHPFVPQLSLSSPLKRERTLFNNTHSVSGNRLYKLNETMQLKLNAGYIHDKREQEKGSETVYFFEEDSVLIREQRADVLHSNTANLQVQLENNADDHYLINKFSIDGDLQKGRSIYSGNKEIQQEIETQSFDARNYLQNMWKRKDYTYEFYSLMRFRHLPSSLKVDDRIRSVNLNHFYTDQAASLLRSRNFFTQKYTAGFTTETSNLKNGYSLFLNPFYQWKNTQWRTTLNLPVSWDRFQKDVFNHILFSPSFFVQFKPNYAWLFSASASHKEQPGYRLEFYNLPYFTDYRTQYTPNGQLSLQKQNYYSLYSEYKNVINEFFSSLSLNRYTNYSDQTTERVLYSDTISLVTHSLTNKGQGWNINGNISKGFFNLRLKIAFALSIASNKGEQLSDGLLIPYRYTYLQAEPKINWSPATGWEANYEAQIRRSLNRIGEHQKTVLINTIQKLNLSYTYKNLSAGTSLEHYYNQITPEKSLHTFFADINLKWKKDKWQIQAEAQNLFNKKQYAYIQYNNLERYSSWINIRPREFKVTLSYRF